MTNGEACHDRRPLAQLKPGSCGIIRQTTLSEAEAASLAAMGLRCNSTIKLCRQGEPCIVSVISGGRQTCTIGLAKPLAQGIIVEPIEPTSKPLSRPEPSPSPRSGT
jgi:Fe2+ transport system protein FeoA